MTIDEEYSQNLTKTSDKQEQSLTNRHERLITCVGATQKMRHQKSRTKS